MAETVRLGDLRGLLFQLAPLPPSSRHEPGLAWADVSVSLAGRAVWFTGHSPEQPGPLQWPMVDFLHGMARVWPWLLLEEGYPIPVMPEHPGMLWQEAERRWEDNMSAASIEQEEGILYDFRQRHDLSLLLRGVQVPPLWVLREGLDCLLWSPSLSDAVRAPHRSVIATLTALGDWIAERLSGSGHPRGVLASQRWSNRGAPLRSMAVELITGLSTAELHRITDDASGDHRNPAEFFEVHEAIDEQYQPGEMLMAARMTRGCLSWANQRRLLEHIRQVTHTETPDLDHLSQEAQAIARDVDPPWQQGYDLAGWLRGSLASGLEQPIDPGAILARWGVPVESIEIDGDIDAAAIWGKARGPRIILNRHARSRASTLNGRRTTLAHEICHLLIDRGRALPVAEVLGGHVSRFAEKRANAFAAELLLPRRVAAQACRGLADLATAASRLESDYQVSRELVYRQIQNSPFGESIGEFDRRRLEDWRLSGQPRPDDDRLGFQA